jgi:hypothetical protein
LFFSQESEKSLCTAVIGCEKGNKLINSFLETYHNKHFVLNGQLDVRPNSELILDFFKTLGKNIKYDFEFCDSDLHIYTQTFFCGKDIHNYKLLVTDDTVCIHNLDATWYGPVHKVLKIFKKIVLRFINLFSK